MMMLSKWGNLSPERAALISVGQRPTLGTPINAPCKGAIKQGRASPCGGDIEPTMRRSTPQRSDQCPWQSAARAWVPHRVPCAWERWYNVHPHGDTGYETPVAGQQRNPAVRAGRRPRAALTLSCECQRVGSDKFGIQSRFAILQQHGDDLAQVVTQLIERFPLRMGSREPGDIPDQKPRCTIPLNDGLEIRFHNATRISQEGAKRKTQNSDGGIKSSGDVLVADKRYQPTSLTATRTSPLL